jgi:hypothetical protein
LVRPRLNWKISPATEQSAASDYLMEQTGSGERTVDGD